MGARGTWLAVVFALAVSPVAAAGELDPDPAPSPDPPVPAPPRAIHLWLEESAGGGTTFEGQGFATRTAISAGLPARRDFLRVRWHYFGERPESDRHPHADWTSTGGILYGAHWRHRDAIASAAIGLGVTSGFARGKLLHEHWLSENRAYRWYRPRRFVAASAIADVFIGAGTRNVAFGVTLSGDANPIRQTGSVQATFVVGALP